MNEWVGYCRWAREICPDGRGDAIRRAAPQEPPRARDDLGSVEWERALIAAVRRNGLLWRTEQTLGPPELTPIQLCTVVQNWLMALEYDSGHDVTLGCPPGPEVPAPPWHCPPPTNLDGMPHLRAGADRLDIGRGAEQRHMTTSKT